MSQSKPGTTSTLRVALVGNPNAGKSLLFNRLTGAAVESSNYPGVTADLSRRTIQQDGLSIELVDLPGVYGYQTVSGDQALTWRFLQEEPPDLVVVVIDATHLARNLSLLLTLLASDCPLLVAGTFGDIAQEEGDPVDWDKLSRLMEIPVVPVVPPRNQGLPLLRQAIVRSLRERKPHRWPLPYPRLMGATVARLARLMGDAGLPARSSTFRFLEGDPALRLELEKRGWQEEADQILEEFRHSSSIRDIPLALNTFWSSLGGVIAEAAQRPHHHLPRRLERFLVAPLSGSLVAVGLLLLIFTLVFTLGGWLAEGLTTFWLSAVSPLLQGAVHALLGAGPVGRVLLWGIDDGILAALTVGIPYIFVFYLILSLLEDSGYLGVLSFLGERLTRLFGLPGRALISLVASAGCNVPALVGTRTLPTQRERFIASFLILLIPCSARTGVVLGAAAPYLGWGAALSLYGLLLLVILGFGLILNRVNKGRASAMIVEIPPLRWPIPSLVLRKTWVRFADFLLIATPILVVGSMVLGTLFVTGAIWSVTAPLRPIVEGWMGLPAVAGLALIFALLRKEMALQLLMVLAVAQFGTGARNLLSFMTPAQLYVFIYFILVSFPCLSAFTVLWREQGWKRSLLIFAILFAFSIFTSGLLYRVLT
jgi:ferrous iron transport protein B